MFHRSFFQDIQIIVKDKLIPQLKFKIAFNINIIKSHLNLIYYFWIAFKIWKDTLNTYLNM